MNKYIIEQDNTGIRVGNFVTSTSTGKIILNGVEITDIDTFNKAVDTFKDLQNEIEEKDKEIERLNNVINELEKDLEEVFDKMKEKQVGIGGRGYYYTDLIPIENILDKLKELKEGKENE